MDTKLVKYLLENRMNLPAGSWTVQGFGFMRLRVDENTRLHIWDSRLRVPGVSDVHDHAQWKFTSTVLSGMIVNVRFNEVNLSGLPYHSAVIQCGVGGGMMEQSGDVLLAPNDPESYLPGESYGQAPTEIHRTFALDGTITLLQQDRTVVDTARVYWPAGTQWVSAEPGQADPRTVAIVGGYALDILKGGRF